MLYRPDISEKTVKLTNWAIYEVESEFLHSTRHFVGTVSNGDGRVSSPIQSFDYKNMSGITRSGKEYVLIGYPGSGDAFTYVFSNWCVMNQITSMIDVTKEYIQP